MIVAIGMAILVLTLIIGVILAGIVVALAIGGSFVGGWLIFKGLNAVKEVVE